MQEHLITGDSSKLGKLPNAHKHKKYGSQLFKNKMVTQVVVKADVLKGREKFFLVKSAVHASMKKAHYTVYVHLHQDSGTFLVNKIFQILDYTNSGGSSVSQNKLPQLILGYIYILKYLQSNFIG